MSDFERGQADGQELLDEMMAGKKDLAVVSYGPDSPVGLVAGFVWTTGRNGWKAKMKAHGASVCVFVERRKPADDPAFTGGGR